MNHDSQSLHPAQPAAAQPPYMVGLNPEQAAAVTATEGPVLVLSGAGTGKTRVLTTRLAYILDCGLARPQNVLAVTFTNKASREMRERVAGIIGPMAENMWLGTFHSIGARILRRHADLFGLTSDFTILDPDDQERLLKQLMDADGIDTKRWTPRGLKAAIDRLKDQGLTPDALDSRHVTDFAGGRVPDLYRQYRARLRTLNACDFGDLLLHTVSLFRDNPDILAAYQDRFRYILVDEYQDTNVAQYLWLRLLAQRHRNLCCVGDDDQSIYSWRGAEVQNILKFERDFPGAKVVRLETNYRSTPRILTAASALIAHNADRLGKTLRARPDRAEVGEPIRVRGVWSGEDEARMVIDAIEALLRDGGSADEIAILVRAGFQTREFEERLIVTGVPYRLIGGPRFYERLEIRDALAYCRVLVQPSDDLAFERIVNKPKRKIGDRALQTLQLAARATEQPLSRAAEALIGTDDLPSQARRPLAELLAGFARWRGFLDSMPHAEAVALMLDESGYTEMWQRDPSADAPGRLENLKEFVAAVEDFETLPALLEHVALVMDNDADTEGGRVSLMTLHAAKGLEFQHVFLPGWEDGIFPHQRALDESGLKGLEEERRLGYVGLTRARQGICISFAANRRIYNQWQSNLPSRFIDELPETEIDRQSETGLYGGGIQAAAPAWQPISGGFGSGRPVEGRSAAASGFEARGPIGVIQAGDRVRHPKFGLGTVESIDGGKMDIAFDQAGRKRVMEGFVTPA